MILSNTAILSAIKKKYIRIGDLTGSEDPGEPPFNTSAIDLRLASEISVPKQAALAADLTEPGVIEFLANNTEIKQLSPDTPYALEPHKFIIAKTSEYVAFPIRDKGPNYSARVEGKSSLARCGILVHFTAPTIHADFEGTITLEIINLSPFKFLLYPGMYFCQLIVEEVKGKVARAPNRFRGQTTAAGKKTRT